jgi:hypothetical protein
MYHALLALLFLAAPPDLRYWQENSLPTARIAVETPRLLKPAEVAPDAAYSLRERWEMKSGFLNLKVEHQKAVREPGLSARQYLEAYGGGIIEKSPGARAEFKERTLLGKPGFELKVIPVGKSPIITRTCLVRDGLEEWRWEVTYAPEFEKEEDVEHVFNSIRLLPVAAAPVLTMQSPGPKLSLLLPGKPEAKEQVLTDDQKKGARSMTVHTLKLPDQTTFHLVHAEYLLGVKGDLQGDFTELLKVALSGSKEKDVPKIELLQVPNAVGYQTRGRTWVGAAPATFRVVTFTAGQHGWGILLVGSNTVRHEKLLDDVVKSLTITP